MIDLFILIKLFFSFLIVIGTLYGVLFFLKRYSLPHLKTKEEDIKIRDVKFVSKDVGFITIEFDKKVFLLAVQNGKVEKITEKDIKESSRELEDEK